jgi:heme-degrading monooxygenase HmoA
MIAVIFEVQPKPEMSDRYFALAAELRHDLENADGFISVERFQSLTEDGKYLSLSFWRDRKAVAAWYAHAPHAAAQNQGRTNFCRLQNSRRRGAPRLRSDPGSALMT